MPANGRPILILMKSAFAPFRRATGLVALGLFSLTACQQPHPNHGPDRPERDLLRANMDKSVDPGVDFFSYANGGWLRRNPIPASESAWSIGNVVQEELYAKLKVINENAASEVLHQRTGGGTPAGEQQKIGDFWRIALDAKRAERLGWQPLRAELERVEKIQTPAEVLDLCFAWQPLGVGAFFGLGVSQDEKHSDLMSVHLSQGGLGLPDRDFYFNPEKGVAHIRAEYVVYIERVLRLLGRPPAEARPAATNLMAWETALAQASRKLEDLRDPERNYNPLPVPELIRTLTPGIQWQARLATLHLQPTNVVVGQPDFFRALDGLIQTNPLPVLRDYLRLRLVSAYAESLDHSLDQAAFVFYHQVLSGQREPRPRWKRVLDAEEGAMGMVLGRIFVREYFPEASKRRYVALVEAIREAYRGRINQLDWMSAATKARAQEKLAGITAKVGYPDKWKDYSALVVGTNSYCENLMNASRWRWNDMVAKFGKPVDRTEWDMTPQTYNAYYRAENNEIVLPAAIFAIPGMRDSEIDDAVVYGYAGASTIGHEITHGFDDEGRKFDAAGNMQEWWTAADAAQFQERAQVMVRQFNAYEPLPGLHINGQASLGENIADYGGLLLGLDAFKRTEQFRSGITKGGLTPLQRYFQGYALGWLFQQREERLRRALLSDVHAPAKWRVLGPLANMPDFYTAYGIATNQPMWRPAAERVKIW